jgi:hypothetical protein
VQKIIAANDLGFGIGEEGVGVARFPAQVTRDFRSVHADGDRAHAQLLNLGQVLFNTP